MTIGTLAKYIRSKNAGPFWITMDIFCDAQDVYQMIKQSDVINKSNIAEIYHVSEKMVKIFFVDDLLVIKVSIPRVKPQGDKYERDMHAGQQYIQLAELQVKQ